jgi:hypothetical protein
MNKQTYKEKWLYYESKDGKQKEAIKAKNLSLLKELIKKRRES